jgi:hypothetical protein
MVQPGDIEIIASPNSNTPVPTMSILSEMIKHRMIDKDIDVALRELTIDDLANIIESYLDPSVVCVSSWPWMDECAFPLCGKHYFYYNCGYPSGVVHLQMPQDDDEDHDAKTSAATRFLNNIPDYMRPMLPYTLTPSIIKKIRSSQTTFSGIHSAAASIYTAIAQSFYIVAYAFQRRPKLIIVEHKMLKFIQKACIYLGLRKFLRSVPYVSYIDRGGLCSFIASLLRIYDFNTTYHIVSKMVGYRLRVLRPQRYL